jgi:hypothetical protein
VLRKCIKTLNIKGIQPYKKEFVGTAISICFFHIPLFRGQFLKLVNEKSTETADVCSALPIYAWQNLFYDKIPESRQKEAKEIWDDIQEHHGD